MRTILCTLLLSASALVTAMAQQNVPKHITMAVEEFAYKPSAVSAALSVLSVVSDADGLYLPDKSMLPQMNEAIVSGAVNIPWVDSGVAEAADYTLRGHITQSEVMTGDNGAVVVRARAYIVDNKTGREVATKVLTGSSLTFASVDNSASLKTWAARDLSRSIQTFVFESLPVTGQILEKGVEQANGKVKEKQCYVDMGSLQGLVPEMRLYVTTGGKYKAELRVVEVMGEDLCACKITKGDSYITKSLAKGVEMVVTSRPKKIE